MANLDTVTNFEVFQWNSRAEGFQKAPQTVLAHNTALPSGITGNFFISVINPDGSIARAYIEAGAASDTALGTVAKPLRWLPQTGGDITGDSSNAIDILDGAIIRADVDVILLWQSLKAQLGAIASAIKHNARPTYTGQNVVSNLRRFGSEAARDLVMTSPVVTDKCWVDGTGEQTYDGTQWQTTGTGAVFVSSWKQPCVAATTGNINLATDVEDGDTLDGVTLAENDRILIKDQTTAKDNGIYVVSASGAPTRASDFDHPSEVTSAAVVVEQGTINTDTIWLCTSNDPTIGTDPIVFQKLNISFEEIFEGTAGENLTAEDLAAMESDGKVYKTVRNVSASSQLGSIAGTPQSITTHKLSTTKSIVIYGTVTAIKGAVVETDRQTATPGTEATIVAGDVRPTKVRSAVIATNKVAITYENTSDNKLYAVVITIAGTTITAGTPVKLYDTETVNQEVMDICQLAVNKFLVSFTNLTSDDAMAVACTVSGTVITPGTALQVEATTAVGATLCAQLATDVACMIYDDGTNLSYVVLEVSGTTITANTALDLYSGSIAIVASLEASGLIVLDTQNVLFYNLDGGALRISRIFNIDDSAWASTPSHEPNHDTYLQIGSTSDANLFAFENGKIGLAYLDADGAIRFKQYELSNNAFKEIYSQTITGITAATTLAGLNFPTEQNIAIIFLTDGTDLEYAIFLDTSDQCIGVVKITASSGQSVQIQIDREVSITGVDPGLPYFVGDAGAVATSGVRRIGVGSNTDKLLLQL
jgi:hypothetical protein